MLNSRDTVMKGKTYSLPVSNRLIAKAIRQVLAVSHVTRLPSARISRREMKTSVVYVRAGDALITSAAGGCFLL